MAKADEFKSKGIDVRIQLIPYSRSDAGIDHRRRSSQRWLGDVCERTVSIYRLTRMIRGSWGKTLGFKDKVVSLSDPDATWAKQLGDGYAIDLSSKGMGWRTGRSYMILDDLKVVKTEVEPNGTSH